MYYDQQIILKKQIATDTDEVGNELPVWQESAAWCGELSVNRAEYFAAATHQFRVEKVIELWDRDYSGEERAVYEGMEYEIYRSFRKNDSDARELYLRR